MSIENVKQFYQVVVQDPALQQQFQSVSDEESLVHLAVEVGQQQGYSFTPDEVMQAITIAQASTDTSGMTELDDEQLESVAGGKGSVKQVAENTAEGAGTGAGIGGFFGPTGAVIGGVAGGAVGFLRGLFG